MNSIKISKRSKLLVLAILWTIGTLFLSITYYLAYQNNFFNNPFFWTSVLLCATSTFFVISDDDIHRNYKMLFLFLFGFTLYLIHILGSPTHFRFPDELLHLQTTKLICRTGGLEGSKLFSEVSRYYPGLQILTASLKFITDLPIFVNAKILVGIVHSFVLVFLYLFFERITSSERIAALGTFLYTGASSQFVFFNSIWSYESLGICLMLIILFLISISIDKRHKQTKASLILMLSIIVLLALVITHHFSSYMLLFFILLLSIIQVIYINSKKEQKYITFTVLTALLIFGWIVYVATITITYFGGMMDKAIVNILKFTVFEREIERVPVVHSLLSRYEVIIDTYFYIPLLFFLFAIGTYFLLKDKRRHNSFIYALIISGFLFFGVLLSIFTESAYLTRAWSFLAMGVSFVGAITLEKMIYYTKKKQNFTVLMKIISFIILILILIGGISIGCKPSHGRYPGMPSSNLMFGPSAITSDVICSAEWFDQKFLEYNNRSTIVTTRITNIIFTTHATHGHVSILPKSWTIFFPKTIDSSMLKYLKDYHVNHVVVDKRISKFIALYGYYFSNSELSLKNHMAYGRNQPLPKECLDKFDTNEFFFEIYDNGNIQIYTVNLS